MTSFKLFNRRAGSLFAVAAIVLSAAMPALVPAFASADQVTTRSIELSSSAKSATNTTYRVNFTSVAAAGAFVVDFCSNTPLVGEACTAPTGLDVTNAASTTSGFTDVADLDTNTVRVTGTIGAAANISVAITGIDNPTVTGPLYARIVTFTDATDANGYTSANPDVVGAHIDEGSVALSITEKIGVSAAVLESMTFCVSKAIPTKDCTGVTAPTLELGEDVGGGVIALSSSALSTGDLYAQISTNAAGGAIVSLKSNATSCGGLLRAGASGACNIGPGGTTGTIAAGDAKFGVKAAAAADPVDATNPSGTFQVKSGTSYDGTNYRLNYVAGNGTGVTSTYGDPILDTDNTTVNNRNMKLTFGASISNSTPAGRYSADLNLIATGKF